MDFCLEYISGRRRMLLGILKCDLCYSFFIYEYLIVENKNLIIIVNINVLVIIGCFI